MDARADLMRPDDGASLLSVRVQPGSADDAVTVVATDPPAITVKVRAHAHDGEANAAVIRLLSATLGIAKTTVILRRGAASRNKLYSIGLSPMDLRARLETVPGTNQQRKKRS
jgi:uncharacterized protein YggU (UPF0235/DUF167 family)